MDAMQIFPAGSTAACRYAAAFLKKQGVALVDHPSPEVTHLLLDVPSFGPDGALRSGAALEPLLEMLPPGITVVGGGLGHPVLRDHQKLDLLTDAAYLAQNAAITAECALGVAGQELKITFAGCPVLVIGWGRIGKCLGRLLQALGAQVTVAARKETDRAMIRALGMNAADTGSLDSLLPGLRLIYNTVPEPVLGREQTARCRECLLIDLASRPGIQGDGVIWARGLPGRRAPESSGALIAQTFWKHTGEGSR